MATTIENQPTVDTTEKAVKVPKKPRARKDDDPNKAPRKSKVEPLSVEAFELIIDEDIREWQAIYTHFTGVHKKNLNFPDGAPGKNEFVGFEKRLHGLIALYKKLARKQKKKVTQKAAVPGAEGKGFKQSRYVNKAAVEFVNTHGDLPAELKLTPQKDVNGDAIWNIAQATQLIIGYVETAKLKTEAEKSKVVLNQPLHDLFKPYFKDVDKKNISERDGKTIIGHTVLQSLIPKLFDKKIPVLASEYSADERDKMAKREVLLRERTATNRGKRDADAKVVKARNQVAAAEKRATAKAEKEALKTAAAAAKAAQAEAKAVALAAKVAK